MVQRAGLSDWPRPFNTLRTSAATDIRRMYGIDAEAVWLGHSPDTAAKHYVRVPETLADMARRCGWEIDAKSDATVTQKTMLMCKDIHYVKVYTQSQVVV